MEQTGAVIRWKTASLLGALFLGGSMVLVPAPVLGDLQFIEAHRDGEAGVEGLDLVRWVAVSPDGRHVYTAGEQDNAVGVFERDSLSGRLTFVTAYIDGQDGIDGLAGACWLTLSPDGAHVYVSGLTEGTVAVFERDATTGELTLVEVQRDGVDGVDGIAGAREAAVSPDGAHLYVAGLEDNAVAVFERDPSTGALSFVELERDQVGGVTGLLSVRSVAVSPDGAHVYASGYDDIAVAVFERDPATGALTFVEAKQNGEDGVEGLVGVAHMTLSPDGRNVYAGGWLTGSVVVFVRDVVTGKLTYLEKQTNGIDGVTDLAFPAAIAVSPDGVQVYVAALNGDAIVVFARAADSGALTFLEAQTEGIGDEMSGDELVAVAVSPDAAHVYAAVQADDSLSVFAVVPQMCCGDANGDGTVTIDELVTAVNNALSGCP